MKNGILETRKEFEYPLNLVYTLFGDDETVDIDYIEKNLKEMVLPTLLFDISSDRERRIFLSYWKDKKTLEQIGREENITRERVRQITNKIVRKLRHPARLAKMRYGEEVKKMQDDITSLKKDLAEQLSKYKSIKSKLEQLEESKEEKEEFKKELFNTDIRNLELSVRSYHCLKRAGITTIGELTQKTEEELMRIRNLGRKTLKEVIQKLSEIGLHLYKENNEYKWGEEE